MAPSLRGARTFAAALPRPMYRITCPSRTRLAARSQVLARHRSLMYRINRSLMYRIIGHYPIVSPRVVWSPGANGLGTPGADWLGGAGWTKR